MANFQPLSMGQPHSMLISTLLFLKSHREPCNEVGYLRQAKLLVGFEPGTFFRDSCQNALTKHAERKTMQPIRIASGPATRMRKWN